jgi:hypothetical protein
MKNIKCTVIGDVRQKKVEIVQNFAKFNDWGVDEIVGSAVTFK